MRQDIKLRIALLSDMHFFCEDAKGDVTPSWLGISKGVSPCAFRNPDNPWSSLESLLELEGISADLLVSPGDITTWADHDALTTAWARLVDLGNRLNVEAVAVATGNHDVTSRPICKTENVIRDLNNPTDLFENLKRLAPAYPIFDRRAGTSDDLAHERRIHYFGADYVVLDENPDYRLVVLNSCARHTTVPTDYERGRIADTTLEWFKKYLKGTESQPPKINILVCHHHPIQHEDHRSGSYDFMQNGQLLMDVLSEHGDWLVIHGHKHQAKLSYGAGSASAPVVFAASSFSAVYEDAGYSLRNQFYLVDLNLSATGGPLKGTINAWNWFPGLGWRKSLSLKDGIFSGCGFGHKTHPDSFADQIASQCASKLPLLWTDVVAAIPEMYFVTPRDMKSIGKSLERRHNLRFQLDNEGAFESLARMN